MNFAELYEKLAQANNAAYMAMAAESEGQDGYTDYSEFIRKADERIEARISEIQNDTADWGSEQWSALFYCHIDHGDPEISAYIIKRIAEACGEGFFAERIRENSECLREDVYSNGDDKNALKASDTLFTAVKALNHVDLGGADDAVIAAFDMCNPVNDHIAHALAEYISRECAGKICEYIADENFSFDKLTTLLSMYVSQKKRDDKIYQALKNKFKMLPDGSADKSMFALILGDYGEPNAILVLRKYIKKLLGIYADNHDKELFSNIMMISSAIEALGGAADDLFA